MGTLVFCHSDCDRPDDDRRSCWVVLVVRVFQLVQVFRMERLLVRRRLLVVLHIPVCQVFQSVRLDLGVREVR